MNDRQDPHRPAVAADLIDTGAYRTSVRETLLAVFSYRELIRDLVSKDLKLKYRGSVFGFLWSLLNPLVMILVYLVAFKYIMAVRSGGFVFLLLIGLLAWGFFAGSLGMAAGSIADNGGLLKTIFFPRAVLPISSVLFNLAQYLLTCAVFLPVMFVIHGQVPSAPALLFPVIVLLQGLLTIGLALALATGTAFFRDIRHLLEIALAVMFWTTPILYDFRVVPSPWRWMVLLSPLSPFVLAYQDVLYYGVWPNSQVWIVGITYAFGAMLFGAILFTRFQDQFAEQI
jgi:lipopolysaccharide transport system permease protein